MAADMPVMPDPKWLEILKASGWQTFAVASACGVTLLLARLGLIPPLPALVTIGLVIAGLLCGFLCLASIANALVTFFLPQARLRRWMVERRQARDAEAYIPHMTDRERAIIAYLLHGNQKVFETELSGGYARPLLSKGIVVRALRPGQAFDAEDMPVTVPDHIWPVLVKHKAEFPLAPGAANGPHPWRVHWMAR